MRYEAPGPGAWELELAHTTRPATRFLAEIFPEAFELGFAEGSRRYGLLLDRLACRYVHDLPYVSARPVGAPPGATGSPPRWLFWLLVRLHPELRARVRTATTLFERRPWREDLRRWREEDLPASVAASLALAGEAPGGLGDAALLEHLGRCREHLRAMIRQHHRYNLSTLPVGDFLAQAQEWSGVAVPRLLGLMRGASPLSAGRSPELGRLVAALRQDPEATRRLEALPPAAAVAWLLASAGELGEAGRAHLARAGHRPVSGHDVGDPTGFEAPGLLVGAIREALAAGPGREAAEARALAAEIAEVRGRVPEGERLLFDALLDEARSVFGLRDERALLGDLWAAGLARRALLALGARLAAAGRLEAPAHAVEATHAELLALARGGEGAPVASELARRHRRRLAGMPADAPPRLGPPAGEPPPAAWLPTPGARRVARAVELVMSAIFDPVSAGPPTAVGDPTGPGVMLRGRPVGGGRREGPARIVGSPEALGRLQPGDVLVAPTTSPAFNVVLPLLAAIVTERGGVLSHAAIVAREYGLPGVVGARDATRLLLDGAWVVVDGDAGTVTMGGESPKGTGGEVPSGGAEDLSPAVLAPPAGTGVPLAAKAASPPNDLPVLLNLADAGSPEAFGGKAAHLASALGAGLPVPPGIALSVAAVDAIAAGDPAVLATLAASVAGLGWPVAVRSSAVGEDGAGASFAGQHLTALHVAAMEALVEAVKAVRASGHATGARTYRERLGLPGTPRMGVVIQRQLEPEVAGVLFTRDPLTGQPRRVIEAAWGLGDAVVAGLVTPDRFVLAPDGAIRERSIGSKDLAIRGLPGGGTRQEEVPPAQAAAPCLDDAMLGRLHALASACEAAFGPDQDLEFAFAQGELFLLQRRPLTAPLGAWAPPASAGDGLRS